MGQLKEYIVPNSRATICKRIIQHLKVGLIPETLAPHFARLMNDDYILLLFTIRDEVIVSYLHLFVGRMIKD